MIKQHTNDYGFKAIEVTPAEGGRISITNYGGTVDIGNISMINQHGLGGSSYIRNKEDIPKHINSIKRTVWINEEEKGALINFLNEF